MKKLLLLVLLGVILLLCGCGMPANRVEAASASTPEATPTPAPTPTPTPTPVPVFHFPDGSSHAADERTLDLSTLSHEDVAAVTDCLRQMPDLREIDLGSDGAWTGDPPKLTLQLAQVERPAEAVRDLTWEDIRSIQDAAPDAQVLYRFVFFGREFTTLDREMDLNHAQMTDQGEAVRQILPCMQNCRYLDMDFCGVSSENMAQIREAYPEMDVEWRIWFGTNCSVRTDVERILASNFDHRLTDANTTDLKYCTKVKYLDLGHNNELHDWTFMQQMPDLEVAVLSVAGWNDLYQFANHPKLWYLEIAPIGHTYFDLEPLGTLTNLEHLCICAMGETDNWQVLKNLTKLKSLWIGAYTLQSFPEGALEELREALPDCEINTTELTGCAGTWKTNPDGSRPERYILVSQIFEYSNYGNVCAYPRNDPKYDPPWYH